MPANSNAKSIKPPIPDQVSELQQKIQLLERDGSAYYESSQATIKKNRDIIVHLRQECKKLHKTLAEAHAGDEQVIKQAFQNRGSEMVAFRNMSVRGAVEVLDQKVCEKVKKLNALKHTVHTSQQQLDKLQLMYESQTVEWCSLPFEEDGKNLRVLENRLEKAQLKCQEAEHIMRSYLKLKDHLQEDCLTFPSQLKQLETEILCKRQELQDLEERNKDADMCKDTAKAKLQRQEEQMYVERREREINLSFHKKQTEDCKAQAERVERKTQWVAMNQDELNNVRSVIRGEDEEERAMSCFEEAFQLIKEATGVTDPQDVVDRFISQQEIQKHLEEMKLLNETILKQLKDEKYTLNIQLNQMKYSGETKLFSERSILEELEVNFQRELQQRDSSKEKQDYLSHILNTITAGMEHLNNKLQHIPLLNESRQEESLEQVIQLLFHAEQKVLWLKSELQCRDLLALKKELEDEEFFSGIEGKLPQYNTRITLPDIQKLDLYEDEENEEDESDIITRAHLKRQSQLIIDSNKTKTRIKKRQGQP